jgi:uncharacterized CHY-type Zn-finger protein
MSGIPHSVFIRSPEFITRSFSKRSHLWLGLFQENTSNQYEMPQKGLEHESGCLIWMCLSQHIVYMYKYMLFENCQKWWACFWYHSQFLKQHFPTCLNGEVTSMVHHIWIIIPVCLETVLKPVLVTVMTRNCRRLEYITKYNTNNLIFLNGYMGPAWCSSYSLPIQLPLV